MTHHKKKAFVIDSCVFAKLFLKEDDRNKAIELLKDSVENNYKVYAPNIFIYEILNICAEKKLKKSEIFEALNQYQNCGLTIIIPSQEVFNKAIDMTSHGHRKSGHPSLYDCVYHALAIENDYIFITSDNKHYIKTKKFGSIELLKDYEK